MYRDICSAARSREDAQAEHGYVTIEAMISFLAFLFIIFTILNVMNYCRVEALISNAVDTAAKELSQYSYFYEMSGLDKYKKGVEQNAEFGTENINDVLSIVNGLYTNVSKTVNQGIQAGQTVWEDLQDTRDPTPTIEGALTNLEGNVYAVEGSIQSIMAAFDTAEDNPLLYIKSIVAVAGNLGLELLVSHVIAAPLAKVFMTKHFGSNRQEADAYLERLGVVDGLDGMNFTMSTLFNKDEAKGKLVHLAVYYKIKVPAILKWAELELPVCKEAITYAWLGGDAVSARVKPRVASTGGITGSAVTGGSVEESPPEETEPPEETKPPIDMTNSFWIGDWWAQYDHFHAQLIKDKLGTQNSEVIETIGEQLVGRDGDIAYGEIHITKAGSEVSGATSMGIQLLHGVESRWENSGGEDGWEPGSIKIYTIVIYVPENFPDREYEELLYDIDLNMNMYDYEWEERYGYPPTFKMNYEIVHSSGNYDYDSEGTA